MKMENRTTPSVAPKLKITEAEAINAIKCNKPTSGYIILCEALDMAVEALEKQIPKKPNLKNATDYEGNITDGVFICSACGRTICYEIEGNFKENYPYCNCGHAIDWNDHPTEKGGAEE